MATHCYFVDVDNTLVHHGGSDFYPGAIEKVNALVDAGHQVWLFTCRPSNGIWVDQFRMLGLKFHGVLPKPLSDNYYYYDDRFISGSNTFVERPEGLKLF